MPTPLEALAGVANAAQPLPGLVTGGQPTEAQFAALKEAGVEVVLDIRDPMEPRPFDEAAVVTRLGMEYLNVPVTGATLTDETMAKILAVLRNRVGRPTLFHCASGNRVAGPMIAHLILDHAIPEGDAVQMGMRIGLRGAEILQWGTDYAAKERGAE